jgi:hypothetical protein
MTDESHHGISRLSPINSGQMTPAAGYRGLDEQLAAWREALEARNCPPGPRLLDDEAALHLTTCERCRERVREEELVPAAYGSGFRKAREPEHPQPGEVWTLRSAQEGWKSDGRYVSSASVFILNIDGRSAEVALVSEISMLAAEGDFDLPDPDWGFVEAWNAFTVRTSELETRWVERNDDLLRDVAAWRSLHGRRLVHGSCTASSPSLEKFRSLELTVASDLTADFFEPEPSDDDALTFKRLIDETDWDEVVPRLLAYAGMRIRICRAREKTPSDYVQEAIAQVLDGRRRMPSNLSFVAFLLAVVARLIDHDNARLEKCGSSARSPG